MIFFSLNHRARKQPEKYFYLWYQVNKYMNNIVQAIGKNKHQTIVELIFWGKLYHILILQKTSELRQLLHDHMLYRTTTSRNDRPLLYLTALDAQLVILIVFHIFHREGMSIIKECVSNQYKLMYLAKDEKAWCPKITSRSFKNW